MDFISIVPNISTSLDLDPEIIKLIISAEDNISRIIIQDTDGYGVCLPTNINKEENTVEFILPEQLCVFVKSETYLCKFECILEDQIIIPFIIEVKIDLKDDGADENAVEENIKDTKDLMSSAEEDMDSILDAIAPRVADKPKKALVEDIIKNLDEEFVKHALWVKEQATQEPQNVFSIPPQVSSERILLKSKMKNILLNMLK